MEVRFWGTRGSLPRSLTAEDIRSKILKVLAIADGRVFAGPSAIEHFIRWELPFSIAGSYGGNTSCVQIADGEQCVICDAGTGLRDFGHYVMRAGGRKPDSYHIFLSHLHWDHIQGFPFFVPAYIPGTRITIYGGHDDLEGAFIAQQQSPFFPVTLSHLPADITFRTLRPHEEYEVGGFEVSVIEQDHPGRSYGYGFRRAGKKVVYSTDAEHKGETPVDPSSFASLIEGADLLVFDAQYAFLESVDMKRDWGHSSNIMAVEFAAERGVKRLVLFHTEPALDDEALDKILDDTRKYAHFYVEGHPLVVTMAYDGLRIEV